jgi:hypothetical protein
VQSNVVNEHGEKVASTHVWDNSVKGTSSVSEAMLTSCEFPEVSSCPWDLVIEQLENNSPTGLLVHCDFELWHRYKKKVQTDNRAFITHENVCPRIRWDGFRIFVEYSI